MDLIQTKIPQYVSDIVESLESFGMFI